MRYHTVLFDADGTLLDFLRSEREAVTDVLVELGVSVDEKMTDAYSRINDELWKQLERGEMTKSILFYRRFELLFERYGIVADARKTAMRYMELLSHKGHTLPGATELCARLKKSAEGVRLCIVTNGTEWIQQGRLADSGLEAYFDEIFISDRIGAPKPKRQFFEFVATHLSDFDPTDTVVVGDSLTSYIVGGIGYGLDTCWYNPAGLEAPCELAEKLTYDARSFDEVYSAIVKGEIA